MQQKQRTRRFRGLQLRLANPRTLIGVEERHHMAVDRLSYFRDMLFGIAAPPLIVSVVGTVKLRLWLFGEKSIARVHTDQNACCTDFDEHARIESGGSLIGVRTFEVLAWRT